MDFEQIYNIIAEHTPLASDCGILCDNLCCKGDDETGMALFPGEESHFETHPENWFSLNDSPYKLSNGKTLQLLICNGTWQRERRPLSCRIFPLIPYITEDGFLEIRADLRAATMCPLLKETEKKISDKFIDALYDTFKLLIENEEILEFIEILSDEQDMLSTLNIWNILLFWRLIWLIILYSW